MLLCGLDKTRDKPPAFGSQHVHRQ